MFEYKDTRTYDYLSLPMTSNALKNVYLYVYEVNIEGRAEHSEQAPTKPRQSWFFFRREQIP